VPSGEGLSPGPDGRQRCRWATSTEDYIVYHDAEWGRPVTDDRAMFERICLEAFQSGLSWLTILRKRDGFRAAFHGFDFDAVATFGDGEIDRLLADASIIRNRAKIEATIANAGATAEMVADGESLAELVWSFAPERDGAPAAMAMSKELKRRGFRFVGPTTAYAAMQACGVVNDHLAGCAFRDEVEAERRQAVGGMRGFSPESSVSGGEAAAGDS
jgi:DNA-3-methyladenine glycosylase I